MTLTVAPPGTVSTTEPVYDADAVAELADLFGPQRLAVMLDGLQEEIGRRLDGVSSEIEVIGQNAHALVSVSGTLGFLQLSRICADLERACLDGGDVGSALDAARAAAARALAAIVRLRAELAGAQITLRLDGIVQTQGT